LNSELGDSSISLELTMYSTTWQYGLNPTEYLTFYHQES